MYYAQNYLKMDKTDRLLDAMEHPDLYSDKEIEAMLADPEVREIYDLLQKTRTTFTPISAPDIDAEWAAFERTRTRRDNGVFRLFSRNFAAAIAIGIVSLAAVAAAVGVGVNYVVDRKGESVPTENAEAVEKTLAADTTAAAEAANALEPGTIVFDNEPLEAIVNRIAGYYGCDVEFSTDASDSLRLYFRWNQARTVDEVVESLNNFEQIHISVKGNTIKID